MLKNHQYVQFSYRTNLEAEFEDLYKNLMGALGCEDVKECDRLLNQIDSLSKDCLEEEDLQKLENARTKVDAMKEHDNKNSIFKI